MTAPAWRAASVIAWRFPQPEGRMSAITPGVSLRRKETIFAAAIAPANERAMQLTRPWSRFFYLTLDAHCHAGNVLSPLVVIRRPSEFLMQAWTPSTGNERVRFSPWRALSPFQRAPLRETFGVRRDRCKRRSIILHFGNGRRRGLRFPRACTLGICVLAACQTLRQDIRADQFPGQPPLAQGGRGHLHRFGFCPIRSALLAPFEHALAPIMGPPTLPRLFALRPLNIP